MFLVVVIRTGWNNRNSKFSPPQNSYFTIAKTDPPGNSGRGKNACHIAGVTGKKSLK